MYLTKIRTLLVGSSALISENFCISEAIDPRKENFPRFTVASIFDNIDSKMLQSAGRLSLEAIRVESMFGLEFLSPAEKMYDVVNLPL